MSEENKRQYIIGHKKEIMAEVDNLYDVVDFMEDEISDKETFDRTVNAVINYTRIYTAAMVYTRKTELSVEDTLARSVNNPKDILQVKDKDSKLYKDGLVGCAFIVENEKNIRHSMSMYGKFEPFGLDKHLIDSLNTVVNAEKSYFESEDMLNFAMRCVEKSYSATPVSKKYDFDVVKKEAVKHLSSKQSSMEEMLEQAQSYYVDMDFMVTQNRILIHMIDNIQKDKNGPVPPIFEPNLNVDDYQSDLDFGEKLFENKPFYNKETGARMTAKDVSVSLQPMNTQAVNTQAVLDAKSNPGVTREQLAEMQRTAADNAVKTNRIKLNIAQDKMSDGVVKNREDRLNKLSGGRLGGTPEGDTQSEDEFE